MIRLILPKLLTNINPFTPKSDHLQISPVFPSEILHSTKNVGLWHKKLGWQIIIQPIQFSISLTYT